MFPYKDNIVNDSMPFIRIRIVSFGWLVGFEVVLFCEFL